MHEKFNDHIPRYTQPRDRCAALLLAADLRLSSHLAPGGTRTEPGTRDDTVRAFGTASTSPSTATTSRGVARSRGATRHAGPSGRGASIADPAKSP